MGQLDIIFLSQTWISENVQNSEIFSDYYLVFRCDRNFIATGLFDVGSTLIKVSNKYKVVTVNNKNIRNVFTNIDLGNCNFFFDTVSLLVSSIYIPHSTSLANYELFIH